MNPAALSIMFADVSLESILQFLRSPRNALIYNGVVVLLLAMIGLALTWACRYLIKRHIARTAANPRRLFQQLCLAHELSGSERRQLQNLAKLLGIDTPAILMIDASLWNFESLSNANKLPPKQRERLLSLQKVLYDQPRLSATR